MRMALCRIHAATEAGNPVRGRETKGQDQDVFRLDNQKPVIIANQGSDNVHRIGHGH